MSFEETDIAAVVLAGGKGTRMKSDLPKVLHEVAGQPMLSSVVDALSSAGIKKVALILGGELELFSDFLQAHPDFTVCVQENRLGTGDAVAAAAICFDGVKIPSYGSQKLDRGEKITAERLLVCAGDTPALDGELIAEFLKDAVAKDSDVAVLGMNMPDPTGYGRLVIGDQGRLLKIVEHKDASDDERQIKACNSGIIFAKTKLMFECLDLIEPNNTQKEYYLTDVIEVAQKKGCRVTAFTTDQWEFFAGVNNPEQKQQVEQMMLKTK